MKSFSVLFSFFLICLKQDYFESFSSFEFFSVLFSSSLSSQKWQFWCLANMLIKYAKSRQNQAKKAELVQIYTLGFRIKLKILVFVKASLNICCIYINHLIFLFKTIIFVSSPYLTYLFMVCENYENYL